MILFFQQQCEDPDGRLQALRATVARIERGRIGETPSRADGDGRALRFGVDAIDRHLGNAGLGPGLHELAGLGRDRAHAAAPVRLAAHLFGRGPRPDAPVLWVTDRRDLHAPGLAGAGLPPSRLLVAEAGSAVLAAMEEGARCPALAGVVGEFDGALTLTASRRLLLVAEASGVPVLAIRRPRRADPPGVASTVDAPNAAITRWRVASLASRPADPITGGPFTLTVGAALWRLDLVRARGASPASWTVEAFDETGRLALLSPSRDRPVAPARPVAAAGDRAA